MEAYQQRVIDEQNALDIKRNNLNVFFESTVFAKLGALEQHRLRKQSMAMDVYSKILGERIAAFTSPKESPHG